MPTAKGASAAGSGGDDQSAKNGRATAFPARAPRFAPAPMRRILRKLYRLLNLPRQVEREIAAVLALIVLPLLRLQLQLRPHDPQLTYSLVAWLARLHRPPVPNAPADATAPAPTVNGSVDALVTAADESARADDLIGVYANLWQACVRFPRTARGWAEYARCFGTRPYKPRIG